NLWRFPGPSLRTPAARRSSTASYYLARLPALRALHRRATSPTRFRAACTPSGSEPAARAHLVNFVGSEPPTQSRPRRSHASGPAIGERSASPAWSSGARRKYKSDVRGVRADDDWTAWVDV